ncbi:MAG: cobalamin-binding protein [Candidatus Cybelea sp.]
MRIVSLLPSATEILFAIGAGDEVVGVTHECDYPPQAMRLPRLTASAGPDLRDPAAIDRHVRAAVHAGSSLYHLDSALLERLVPDLIVTQELCEVCAVSYDIVQRAAKQLRASHPQRSRSARIVSLEPASLDDVFATISFLGEATHRVPEAEALLSSLRARVVALERESSHRTRRPRTLTLEWTDPPMSAGHWIPGLVELAGGEPVLGNPGANSQRLEWLAIARAQPEAVIVSPCGFDLDATRRAVAQLDAVAEWRELDVQRSGRILLMDGNAYLSRPGPRLVEAAEILARWYTTVAEYAG